MELLLTWLVLSVLQTISIAQDQSLLETLDSISSLSNLTTLVQSYESTFTGLSNITLLAPNNNAFSVLLNSSTAGALASDAGLLAAILDYHILNGTYNQFPELTIIPTRLEPGAFANVTGGQRVEALGGGGNSTFLGGLLQNATVVSSANFTGGIIHVVDSFLTLPQNASTTAIALNLTAAVGAFTKLSLANTLDNTMDITIFVPNNAAFQQVGGNLANLSTDELTSVLEYHMVPGSVLYSTDLSGGEPIETLGGRNLTVTVKNGNIYVNNGKVILANALTRNGVIHVIDRVLSPGDSSAGTGSEAFLPASSASDVPFTSGVATPTSSIAPPSTESASGSTTSSASGSGSGSGSGAGSSSKSHSNVGAIAGGVVGGVLAVALLLFLFWFIRRKRTRNNAEDKSATSNSSGHGGGAVAVGRKETTKSYHKPELEATTKSYQKPELEAGTVSMSEPQPRPNVTPAANEIDAPVSRIRTELSGSSAPQGTAVTLASPATVPQDVSTQEEQYRILQEQEEEEARFAEIAHQRRQAELEYQKKMAELEHEQRMAELDITAARLRSRNRTVSELEARANPGPGSAE